MRPGQEAPDDRPLGRGLLGRKLASMRPGQEAPDDQTDANLLNGLMEMLQ